MQSKPHKNRFCGVRLGLEQNLRSQKGKEKKEKDGKEGKTNKRA